MKALIIGNGAPPRKSDLKYLQKCGYQFLVAADGGANSLRKMNILPEIIIGDLDSVTQETLKYFSGKVKIKRLKRQSDTDVEKALKFLISKKFEEVILLGATGDRLDHSLYNIGAMLKYSDEIKIGILHGKTFGKVYEGEVKLNTVRGETISFFAFSSDTLITTKGLKYALNRELLPFGVRSSESNEAKARQIELKIEGGKIILFREFEILKRNDFFFQS